MARIRTIKPEFFRHSVLHKLEVSSGLPIRVAFAGLWTACDREGRFRWDADTLKLDCLPYDAVDFAAVLEALRSAGFICRYEVNGRAYGHVPSWRDHQAPNVRESPSRLPAHESDAGTCMHVPRDVHACAVAPDAARGEGKGTGREKELEGKGKEGTGEPAISFPPITPDGSGVMDTWFHELLKSYPAHRMVPSQLAVNAFCDALEGHGADAPWMRWERMRSALENHKQSAEWLEKDGRTVPSLENWLVKGLWQRKLAPPKSTEPVPNPKDPRVQMDAWLKRKQAEKGASA